MSSTPSSIRSDAKGCSSRSPFIRAKILEGRNRYVREGDRVPFTARDFAELPPGKDPKEFVYAAKQRRHLTTEQRRVLIIRLLRERPHDSDRKIAL